VPKKRGVGRGEQGATGSGWRAGGKMGIGILVKVNKKQRRGFRTQGKKHLEFKARNTTKKGKGIYKQSRGKKERHESEKRRKKSLYKGVGSRTTQRGCHLSGEVRWKKGATRKSRGRARKGTKKEKGKRSKKSRGRSGNLA